MRFYEKQIPKACLFERVLIVEKIKCTICNLKILSTLTQTNPLNGGLKMVYFSSEVGYLLENDRDIEKKFRQFFVFIRLAWQIQRAALFGRLKLK